MPELNINIWLGLITLGAIMVTRQYDVTDEDDDDEARTTEYNIMFEHRTVGDLRRYSCMCVCMCWCVGVRVKENENGKKN